MRFVLGISLPSVRARRRSYEITRFTSDLTVDRGNVYVQYNASIPIR